MLSPVTVSISSVTAGFSPDSFFADGKPADRAGRVLAATTHQLPKKAAS